MNGTTKLIDRPEPAPALALALALADQTKAHISAIYAASGDLFQTRKLGDPTVPLNVQIGGTGLHLQTILSALNLPLSSAEVRARLAPDGDKLVLQWTTCSCDRGWARPSRGRDRGLRGLGSGGIRPAPQRPIDERRRHAARRPADAPELCQGSARGRSTHPGVARWLEPGDHRKEATLLGNSDAFHTDSLEWSIR